MERWVVIDEEITVVFAHWSTRWFNCLTIMDVRWHCSRPFGTICSLKLDLGLIPLC